MSVENSKERGIKKSNEVKKIEKNLSEKLSEVAEKNKNIIEETVKQAELLDVAALQEIIDYIEDYPDPDLNLGLELVNKLSKMVEKKKVE